MSRKSFVFFAALVAGVAVAAPTRAHGPQIQVTAEGGKIVTRRMFADEPYAPLQAITSIYVLPTVQQSGEWLVTPPSLTTGSGPGLAVGFGYDAANPGAHPFQTGGYTVGFADGLKRWDGAAFVDAGATQMRLNKNATTADTTDVGPFPSVTWNITVTSAGAHSGLGYRFLGDGISPTSPLPTGVYLLSLELSHGSLTKSDPYYFVIPRGVGGAEVQSAVAGLASAKGIAAGAIQSVVPEPGAAALAGAALATLAAHRRRTRVRAS
jgi:MYXO-CTERM domain-containing protein